MEDDYYSEAVKCFTKAAKMGLPEAQVNLGWCYLNGVGVEKNDIEAAKYFRMAAEKGLDIAQNNLGVCFEQGRGVPKDKKKAKKTKQDEE